MREKHDVVARAARRLSAGVLAALVALVMSQGCQLVVEDTIRSGIGERCTGDAECQAAECIAGLCAARCSEAKDCPAPSACTSAGLCEIPLDVGFVYVGVIEDEGWTLTHEQGRREAAARLPYLRTDVATNIFLPADITNVVESFIERGSRVIVANSFSQREAIKLAAQRHPDVKFLICSGNETAPNVGTYFARMEQAYFIAGYVAGQITTTKRLGFVGSYVTPEVVRHANAFTRGARRANPEIVVEIRWEGFWFDLEPPVDGEYDETRLARELLGTGCDVLAHNMDNSRVNRAVEAAHVAGANVFSIGNDNRDACATAPNSCLGTSYWSWGTLYTELFDQIHRGTWDPSQPINEPITANVETSPIGFAVNTPVTGTDIAISANELLASLSKPGGKSLPFTGPLCSTGQRASCVGEGEAVADAELLTMCWFVDGVVEKVDPLDPKSADRPARVPDACLTQQ